MDPIIIIEYPSSEWIRNIIITIFLMMSYFLLSLRVKDDDLLLFLKLSGLSVLAMTLCNHIFLVESGSWEISKDLPLHLCSISALICCVIFFVKEKQFLFDFLFYAGIIGGILSILTPQITLYDQNYFYYVMFYFKHAAIIIIPIVMMYRMKMKLSKHSWLKIFVVINILLAIIIPINSTLGSNFLYVAEPPNVSTPLIVEGNETILGLPIHVIYWEIILIILVLLFYFCFRKKE